MDKPEPAVSHRRAADARLSWRPGQGGTNGVEGADERPAPPAKPKQTWHTTILRIMALAVVIGITVGIYLIRDRVQEFAAFGYPGIFLIVLISYATILMPVPGMAVVFSMSGVFHPLGVALVAATGGAIGEISGYLAGYSGRAIIENWKMYDKITARVRKYGGPAILVLAALPNPFFDLVGVAAGVLKMPLWKFLLWCWPGQIIKMLYVA
ncbi:MAG: VTT domain-containing protein, partial [Anaerolineales bacterium]|nr:VTT domain-containing protein [Anaerolineales bacterium]